MQSSPLRDLAVGLFVLVGLSAVGYLSLNLGGLSYSGDGGLELHASFDEIGELAVRAPVKVSGVKVGKVTKIDLDGDLRAQVTLEVDRKLELPVDTSASIRTAGLLGDQYIELEPGAEDQLLGPGATIALTESALNIEKLVGSLVHDADLGGGEEGE